MQIIFNKEEGFPMFQKLRWINAALIVLALLLSACGQTPTTAPATTAPASGSLSDEEAQDLLIGLGQIRGHLLISLELYKQGDDQTAAVHAAHPVAEVFSGIAALVFEKPGQAE